MAPESHRSRRDGRDARNARLPPNTAASGTPRSDRIWIGWKGDPGGEALARELRAERPADGRPRAASFLRRLASGRGKAVILSRPPAILALVAGLLKAPLGYCLVLRGRDAPPVPLRGFVLRRADLVLAADDDEADMAAALGARPMVLPDSPDGPAEGASGRRECVKAIDRRLVRELARRRGNGRLARLWRPVREFPLAGDTRTLPF